MEKFKKVFSNNWFTLAVVTLTFFGALIAQPIGGALWFSYFVAFCVYMQNTKQ